MYLHQVDAMHGAVMVDAVGYRQPVPVDEGTAHTRARARRGPARFVLVGLPARAAHIPAARPARVHLRVQRQHRAARVAYVLGHRRVHALETAAAGAHLRTALHRVEVVVRVSLSSSLVATRVEFGSEICDGEFNASNSVVGNGL